LRVILGWLHARWAGREDALGPDEVDDDVFEQLDQADTPDVRGLNR
jgi:hypothetical protein